MGLILGGMILIGGVVWEGRHFGWWNGRDDIRLGVLADNDWGVIVISPSRKMVSKLRVKGEVKVWVPRGYGWYRADKLKKLLELEGKIDGFEEVGFYNFGFVADQKMVVKNFDDWKKTGVLVTKLGVINGLRLKGMMGSFLDKEEEVDDVKNFGKIKEQVVRDFVDTAVTEEAVRVSVLNTTEEQGLAGWLGERLVWAGFGVVNTGTAENRVEKCLLVANKNIKKSKVYRFLEREWGCEEREGEIEDQVELYIGKGWTEMLNYSSYNNLL